MNHIDIFQNHFKAVFPEIFFVIAVTIILLFSVCYNPSASYRYPVLINVTAWLGIQTLFIVILLLINWNTCQAGASVVAFNNVLIVDDFTFVIKTIVSLSALSSILISLDYIRNQKINSFEYIILILFSTLSMLLIISSYDLISMYLAIELQSLSFYVIAAFQRNNEFSTEAGLKYFILGALSSGLLLFGESIIYGFTGITNFEELTKLFSCAANDPFPSVSQSIGIDISSQLSSWTAGHSSSSLVWDTALHNYWNTNAIIIGLLFLLVAFLFKISAVPFHMWTPDVYEGAPTSVTAFFAITPKIAILSLLLRLCLYTFYDFIELWQQPIAICSILSMFIGTFGAINQTKIKRLFAYSSIAHIGYMLLGLATGTIEAVESLLIYIIVYIFMIVNVFAVITATPRHEILPHFAYSHSLRRRALRVPLAFSPSPLGETSVGGFMKTELFPKSMLGIPLRYPGQGGVQKGTRFPFLRRFREGASCIYKTAPDLLGSSGQSLGLRDLALMRQLKASYPFVWNPFSSHRRGSDSQAELSSPCWHSGSGVPIKATPTYARARGKGAQSKKDVYIKYISDLRFLAEANPILAFTLAIIFFSNAGIPPLAGFYGKLNVFLAAVEESMYFLSLAGVICSVIGAFYSIRLVKIIYFHSSRETLQGWTQHEQISKQNAIVLGFTFFFTLFFFVIYPSWIFTLTHSAAQSLCL